MANVRRKMKEKWMSNEGRRVFISRESGEWGDAGRLARNERAKPHGAALGLEAGTGGPFTRTEIISLEIDKWSLRVHLLDGTLDVWADVGQGPPLTFGSLLCFCIFIK
jgi:hypothetical protein